MARGIQLKPIELEPQEREFLEGWARRRKTAQALALRARIVLLAAEGRSNSEVAEYLHTTRVTVGKWRSRFARDGIQGLFDSKRPGRPRLVTDAKVEEVITKTLETTPRDATHWSTRSMSEATGLSPATIFREFRLR